MRSEEVQIFSLGGTIYTITWYFIANWFDNC